LENFSIQHNSSFPQTRLEDYSCHPATSDPYGAVVPGSSWITLTAPCLDGTIVRSDRNRLRIMILLTVHVQAFFESDAPLNEAQIGARVKCLFPRGLDTRPKSPYIEALVLSVSHSMDDHQRIGILHLTRHYLQKQQQQGESLPLMAQTIRIT
jgi:hypothetical protein